MECASTEKGIRLIAALTSSLSLTYDHGSEPIGTNPQLLRGATSVGNDPHDGGTGLIVSDPAPMGGRVGRGPGG